MFRRLESVCSRKTIPLPTALHLQLELNMMSSVHVHTTPPHHVAMLMALLNNGHGMARQCMCCGCGPVVEKPAASTIVSETLHLLDNDARLYCVLFIYLFVLFKKREHTPKIK